METIKWYLKQLLPLSYHSTFTENGERKSAFWRMWFGRCFSIREYVITGSAYTRDLKVEKVQCQINQDRWRSV